MTAREVTLFLHSRTGGRLLGLLGLIVLAVAAAAGFLPLPGGLRGEVGGRAGLVAAIGADLLIITIFRLIHKRFNIMRRETSLGAPLFVAFIAAIPWCGVTLYTGTILPLALLPVSYILFTTYADRAATRTVFLIFAIVTALGFVTPVFLWYLPVLLAGCAQMRVLSFRSLVAALLGIITPPWIALGFRLCTPDALPLPSVDTSWLSGGATPFPPGLMLPLGAVILIGEGMMFANLYKIMSYNAMTRSMNGFFTLMLIATTLLAILDFYNLPLYLPMLLALTSYQATLFFVTRTSERSCIGIIMLVALLWGFFIWNICLTPTAP